ncbi:hypothetical protein SPACI_007370 [Sporomusa acidovorans DSM 3132]|uniref:Uncharacterized protein n=1 Tax=Sporomusa acidovorans (strain ATCC 49682 / DSM 3132 / Mol) TaxID=1123286 RepID=A0ABZ3IYB1_SPOA4|nr:hypothetical protein SPACI_13900 [Sporomusa acidovorans DSM 3132]SDE46235.1 hypothetical protein SAMN04488499_101414 [Sporomusa acidovorans]
MPGQLWVTMPGRLIICVRANLIYSETDPLLRLSSAKSESYTLKGTGERLSPWIRVTNFQMGLKPHLKLSLLYLGDGQGVFTP